MILPLSLLSRLHSPSRTRSHSLSSTHFPSSLPQVPFESLLDMPSFTLRILQADIPRLIEIVNTVTPEREAEMRSRLHQVWQRWVANGGEGLKRGLAAQSFLQSSACYLSPSPSHSHSPPAPLPPLPLQVPIYGPDHDQRPGESTRERTRREERGERDERVTRLALSAPL